MPLIAMNREMGSLGKDVAQGLSQELGLKIQHHEIVDHLANRARIRKSHVISFLEGTQGFFERLTIDQVKLRVLTADEIVSAAENNEGIILRGWGATSLLKEVPHAVRVCVSASRRERVRRMMRRLDLEDEAAAGRIVAQNDESAQAVMRRHFHIDVRDINEYDVGFNTDPWASTSASRRSSPWCARRSSRRTSSRATSCATWRSRTTCGPRCACMCRPRTAT